MYQRELTLMLHDDATLVARVEAIDARLEGIERQRHDQGGAYPLEWYELLDERAAVFGELYCRGLEPD